MSELDCAIDRRRTSARHPRQNVVHISWAGEGGRLRAVQIKLTEALKKIAAYLLSKIGLDHEIRAQAMSPVVPKLPSSTTPPKSG